LVTFLCRVCPGIEDNQDKFSCTGNMDWFTLNRTGIQTAALPTPAVIATSLDCNTDVENIKRLLDKFHGIYM
jgi:hypothetical protein